MKSDIPEGATHKTKETDILDTLYYKFDEVWWCYSRIEDYWFKSYEVDRYFNCLELIKQEKQMDSIYTQEMHDAGELPKVGMKLLFRGFEISVVAVTETEKSPILTFIKNSNTTVEACFFQLDNSLFKPIDTKTDKEKAIDDLKASYDEWENVSNEQDTFAWILDDIKAGKIHGVTFTENKND